MENIARLGTPSPSCAPTNSVSTPGEIVLLKGDLVVSFVTFATTSCTPKYPSSKHMQDRKIHPPPRPTRDISQAGARHPVPSLGQVGARVPTGRTSDPRKFVRSCSSAQFRGSDVSRRNFQKVVAKFSPALFCLWLVSHISHHDGNGQDLQHLLRRTGTPIIISGAPVRASGGAGGYIPRLAGTRISRRW